MIARMVAVTVGVMTMACASAQQPPETGWVTRRADDPFAGARSQVAAATFSAHPTSGEVINTDLVERIVREKLRQVESNVFRDLLRTAGDLAKSKVAQDFIDALTGLIVQVADGDARSQTLQAALWRDGLSAALAGLTLEGLFDRSGCKVSAPNSIDDVVAVSDAVYEALAQSTFMRPLGFPKSDKKVAKACETYAKNITVFIDTFARLGLNASKAIETATARLDALSKDCASLDKGKDLLALVAAAKSTPHAAAQVAAIRDVRNAITSSRLRDATPQQPADNMACYGSLTAFAKSFDDALLRVSTDNPPGMTVADVEHAIGIAQRVLAPAFAKIVSRVSAASKTIVADENVLLQFFGHLDEGLGALRRLTSVDPDTLGKCGLVGNLENLGEPDKANPSCDVLRADAPALKEVLKGYSLLMKLMGKSAPQTFMKDLQTVKSDIEREVGSLGDSLQVLEQLRGIVVRLSEGLKLRRGDVTALVNRFEPALLDQLKKRNVDGTVQDVVKAVLDAIPQSIREDDSAAAGLRFDVPALASTIIDELANKSRKGPYLRATIGVGYIYQAQGPNIGMTPAYYEELGAGIRAQFTKAISCDWHAIASGLLFKISAQSKIDDMIFVATGPSCNFYQLIDLSASAGWMFIAADDKRNHVGFSFGLQIPLSDYFSAVFSGGADAQTTTSAGKK